MMPGLLGIVALVFLIRKNVDGMQNRCIQMALTSIFLRYTEALLQSSLTTIMAT